MILSDALSSSAATTIRLSDSFSFSGGFVPKAQSREEAEVWYISYNRPSFGKTAVEVVEQGHAKAILDYIERGYEVRYSGDTLDGDATIKLLEAINEMKKET